MAEDDTTAGELTVEGLADRIAMLEAKNVALEQEIAGLRRGVRGGPIVDGPPAPAHDARSRPSPDIGDRGDSPLDTPVSRRRALTALSGAAAGGLGLALGSTFLDAVPAAATTEYVTLGADNDTTNLATSPTEIINHGGTAIYAVTNTPSDALGANVSTNGNYQAAIIGDGGGAYPATVPTLGIVGLSASITAIYGVTGGPSNVVDEYFAGAIVGDSNSAAGVAGASNAYDGVDGYTSAPSKSGVKGADLSGSTPGAGGYGVSGDSTYGTGIYGVSSGPSNIIANPIATQAGVFGDSDVGPGVVGTSKSTTGVEGFSGTGLGVLGLTNGATVLSPTGIGVWGGSSDGHGVVGNDAATGIGVLGQSVAGVGVQGYSGTSYGVEAQGGLAPLYLSPAGQTGPPAVGSGTHQIGEIYLDSKGSVFICTGASTGSGDTETAGTWQQLCAAAPRFNDNNAGISGSLGQAGSLNLLAAPIRVFDSRVADPPADPSRAAGEIAAQSTTTLQITGTTVGGLAVPADAVGVIGNDTVASPAGAGYLTLFPAGQSLPSTSSVNFESGDAAARCNFSITALSATGQLSFYNAVQCHVVFDVVGFIF